MSYITIDVSDYTDEEYPTTIDVDADDFWWEIDDEDLLEEAKRRDLHLNTPPPPPPPVPDYSHPETLRRHLCDVFEVPYSTKPYDLAGIIANKLDPNYIYQLQEFLCEEYYTMKAELKEFKKQQTK